jgi:5-methylcytosine-specific restriction endonuclease McrA
VSVRLRTRIVNGRAVATSADVRAHPRGRAYERVRLAVAERDAWICQLCGQPIDRRLRRPDPMALSVHHVIEFAAGGSHAMSNLQAAHDICH